MAKRLTAQDYTDKYADLLQKTVAMQARIKARAEELCKLHPTVPIGRGAVGREIDKMNYSVLEYIEVIRYIEKYLADQHPHQQQSLFK